MTILDFPAKISSNRTDSVNHSQQKSVDSGGSQWGYDLYPERRAKPTSNFWKGRDNFDKIKCEQNVYQCVKNSPLVKLMMAALKSSGCPVDIRRHISCEECAPHVSGGFDPLLNQVVICQNVARSKSIVQGVLTHEMIHMFDYCQNYLDFKNLDHLACTEIRAANLAHCSFLSAWTQGDVSLFDIAQSHQKCVKTKALSSILAARNVTKEEAQISIDKVFSRCYSDLEPLGRRLRRNSEDMCKAYNEGPYYGYDT